MNGRGRWARQEGSATVYVAGALVALTVLVGFALAAATQVLAAAQAQNAADMAATAGAYRLVLTGDGPAACAQAGFIAERNRARVVSCTVAGGDLVVVAAKAAPLRSASATARAGPAAVG